MSRGMSVMKLLVSCEQVNDTRVWGARIDEIRLTAVGNSRDEVITLARECMSFEYPELLPFLEVEDES